MTTHLDRQHVLAGAGALVDGEALRRSAGVSTLVYHRPGRDRSAPLMVFIPGGGHLARVFYGYPGGISEDFVDHWLAEAGFGMLTVSVPVGPRFGQAFETGLTRPDWAEAIATCAEEAIEADGQSRSVVILPWSLGGSIVGHLVDSLCRRNIDIAGFMPLSASSPLPRSPRSYRSEERLDADGLWDVAGSRLFGVERLRTWQAEIRSIEAELGRTVLSPDDYERHILTGTPIGIVPGGLARSFHPTEEPDLSVFPFATPIVPTGEQDYRHAIGDAASWAYVNAQIVLARYVDAFGRHGRPMDGPAWAALTAVMADLQTGTGARIAGGHFFFLGARGARETAGAIADLLPRGLALRARLARLLPEL